MYNQIQKINNIHLFNHGETTTKKIFGLKGEETDQDKGKVKIKKSGETLLAGLSVASKILPTFN